VNTLAEILLAARPRTGEAVVTDRRDSLGSADLLDRSEAMAQNVRRQATRPTPLVVALLPNSTAAVTLLLAAVLSDFTLAFVDPAGDPERREAVLDALDPDLVVDADGLHPQRPTTEREGAAGYIAMSSGSTGGGPKGVLSTWVCLGAFVPHGADALQLDATAHWAEPSHPSYDLAMTNLVLALASGASVHVSGSLGDRLRPLAFVTRVGATHVRLAPRYIDLAANEKKVAEAPDLRVWGSGGDRLSALHAARILELGIPTLVNTYGTSETAGFASASVFTRLDDPMSVHGTVSIGVGELGPWRTELVTESMADEPALMLAISSPYLRNGYLFGGSREGYPRWDDDRVVTGDLGARDGADLFCLGRSGRLVKRSATFVNLDDLDLVLREHQGLTSFTVSTRGGALVSLVEGNGDGLDDARRALQSLITPEVVPDAVVGVPALPRLGNGKIDQAQALRLAEEAVPENV
jgi:acyl-CoA synthetase (AMP-forming)/AMP-acid ligase II